MLSMPRLRYDSDEIRSFAQLCRNTSIGFKSLLAQDDWQRCTPVIIMSRHIMSMNQHDLISEAAQLSSVHLQASHVISIFSSRSAPVSKQSPNCVTFHLGVRTHSENSSFPNMPPSQISTSPEWPSQTLGNPPWNNFGQ